MAKSKCKCCGCEIKEVIEKIDICPQCGKNPGVETITSVFDRAKKQRKERKKNG